MYICASLDIMCDSVCLNGCLCVYIVVFYVHVCVHVYKHVLSLPGRVKLWADTFGRDLYNTVTKYSGSLLLQKVSNPLPGTHRVVRKQAARDFLLVVKQSPLIPKCPCCKGS